MTEAQMAATVQAYVQNLLNDYGFNFELTRSGNEVSVKILPRSLSPSPDESRPDDIRDSGWMVAVHNDYRLGGKFHTFWLFTKEGIAIKGEGQTDAEALNQVRQHLHQKGGQQE